MMGKGQEKWIGIAWIMKNRYPVVLTILMLILTSFIGYTGSRVMEDFGRNDIETESRSQLDTTASHVGDNLIQVDNAVEVMAKSTDLRSALTSDNETFIDQANVILDTYRYTFEVSVCYLMNGTGITIASSNRNDPSSFVGKDYSFRPYFTEAIRGIRERYYALGVTSGVRGYYSSYPVRAENGTIIGVAVIKQELDFLEQDLRQEGYTFLVSPDEVIFISGTDGLINHTLGRLNAETRLELETSRQFGEGPFEPFTHEPVETGDEVEIDGTTYLVSRKTINDDGWSVVTFRSLRGSEYFLWLGYLITLLV
jgi:C4-dicarboxylate-specific signal transduction histidine kinase